MALNATTLATALESAFKSVTVEGNDHLADISTAIASEVIDHITANAQVTVAAAIPVATAGSATNQTGVTTAPGTGTIS